MKWNILYFIFYLLGKLENSLQRGHDVIMTQSCVYWLFPFPHSLISLEKWLYTCFSFVFMMHFICHFVPWWNGPNQLDKNQ
jgi:hypothetical protein